MIFRSEKLLKYKYTTTLFVLYVVAAFYIIGNENDAVWVSAAFSLINAILLILLGLYISRMRRLAIVVLLPLTILLTASVAYRFLYSSPLNIGTIASVFETNLIEARGVGMPMLLTSLPLFIFTYALLYLSTRELLKFKIRLRYLSICILACLVLLVVIVPLSITGRRKAQFENYMKSDPALYLEDRAIWRLPLVVAPVLSIGCYFSEMAYFRKQLQIERTVPECLTFDSEKPNSPSSIFVLIGESSVPHHYSLYGYDKKTTPFLDSLQIENSLNFYSAISPAPFTRDALRFTLSFATPQDKDAFYTHENNVSLANKSGYDTYWISNQNVVGLDDSYIGMLAYYAKTTLFYNYQKNDIDIVRHLKEFYDPNKKQVFYLHLKGSHLPYDGFDEVDSVALDEGDEFDKYDKTIHHTDRVINALYSYIGEHENTNAVILYYSDHGEIINKGHGFFSNTKLQFSIPFISIPVNANVDTDSIIKKYHTNDYFNSINLNYVLAELMGYSVSDEAVDQARIDGLYVYHVDGNIYCFSCDN